MTSKHVKVVLFLCFLFFVFFVLSSVMSCGSNIRKVVVAAANGCVHGHLCRPQLARCQLTLMIPTGCWDGLPRNCVGFAHKHRAQSHQASVGVAKVKMSCACASMYVPEQNIPNESSIALWLLQAPSFVRKVCLLCFYQMFCEVVYNNPARGLEEKSALTFCFAEALVLLTCSYGGLLICIRNIHFSLFALVWQAVMFCL